MKIRRAIPEDAPLIAALLVDSWQSAYRGLVPDSYLDSLDSGKWTDRIRESIESGTGDTFVAEIGGELLGCLTVGECRDNDLGSRGAGEIWGLYVDPVHWGAGIGKQLCRYGEQVLAGGGETDAVVWVFAGNRAGRSFWEAMGFEPDGASKELERVARLEAVRYRKRLESIR